jgi:hypothetical protein
VSSRSGKSRCALATCTMPSRPPRRASAVGVGQEVPELERDRRLAAVRSGGSRTVRRKSHDDRRGRYRSQSRAGVSRSHRYMLGSRPQGGEPRLMWAPAFRAQPRTRLAARFPQPPQRAYQHRLPTPHLIDQCAEPVLRFCDRCHHHES